MRLRDRRIQTSYPVRLTCQAIGFPMPEIQWFKDSVIVPQNGELLFNLFMAGCTISFVLQNRAVKNHVQSVIIVLCLNNDNI